MYGHPGMTPPPPIYPRSPGIKAAARIVSGLAAKYKKQGRSRENQIALTIAEQLRQRAADAARLDGFNPLNL